MFSYFYGSANPSWSLRLPCQLFSNRRASLQVDPIISTFARSILSFLNGVCFIRLKLPLFSCPPTLFLQGLRFLNQVSFLLMRSLFILFFQCSYPVIPHEDAQQFQVHQPSLLFLLRWINLSFGVDHISSFRFTYLPMWISYPRLSYLFTSPSSYPECWRYLRRFAFSILNRSS